MFGIKPNMERAEAPGIIIPPREIEPVIDARGALALPAVWRCTNILTNGISQLDINVYRSGERLPTPLVIREPDEDRTRAAFLKRTVTCLALRGEAFWLLNFKGNGQVQSMTVLDPTKVVIGHTSTGRKTYSVGEKTYKANEVKHLRYAEVFGENHGVGPIQANMSLLQSNAKNLDYNGQLLGKGYVPGYLKTGSDIDAEAATAIEARWEQKTSAGRPPVLGYGFEFVNTGLLPADLQLLEALNLNDKHIALLFGVPSAYLEVEIGGSSLTYQNRRDLDTQLVRHGFQPFITEIESAMSEVLPRGQEARFDVDGYLRADTKERYETYATGIGAGFLTPEEVREKEHLPPLEKGAAPADDTEA